MSARFIPLPFWRRAGAALLHRLRGIIRSDRLFSRWEYFFQIGRMPDLDNPVTYNEKLQWFKLQPLRQECAQEYARLIDKASAKDEVKKRMGSDSIIIPTYGVWERWDDIDFDSLPSKFVLKTTHDSGTYCICRDKNVFDFTEARRKIERSLRSDYSKLHRERLYSLVRPRIIAEQLLEDKEASDVTDYKFFCFDGEPRMLYVATDRSGDLRFDLYDMEFRHCDAAHIYPNAEHQPERPVQFDRMVEIARQLSAGIQQVRVDLYNIGGKIYFGEYTFINNAGIGAFYPPQYDALLGSYWHLRSET